eukprot:9811771-Alexandrium_andersonii.AAC.1
MVLTAVGRPRALAVAWCCEKQDSLATAVQREWERRAQAFGTTPYRRAAADVWDPCRNDAAPLREVLRTT